MMHDAKSQHISPEDEANLPITPTVPLPTMNKQAMLYLRDVAHTLLAENERVARMTNELAGLGVTVTGFTIANKVTFHDDDGNKYTLVISLPTQEEN